MRNIKNDSHSWWKEEYNAPFSGWDFSHLNDRWRNENPPWDYTKMARQLVRKSTALLDMGTGGGEFLASLAPLPEHTCVTEGWAPNVPIARERLDPLGIKVVAVDEDTGKLPFGDREFDTVLNRHEDFHAKEVFRILKPGGMFLTQQVGGNNLHDFADAFDTGIPLPYLKETFAFWEQELQDAGFHIISTEEWSGKQEFTDVGAIAYYIKAVPWTAPGFDIEKNMADLEELQHKLDTGERLVFTQVRFLFQTEKPH